MHNNFTLDRTPKSHKAFYTVTEVAVQWARSEGAKSANDPRINHYSQLLLESLANGALRAAGSEISLSSDLAFSDLKHWFSTHFPNAKPTFLSSKI